VDNRSTSAASSTFFSTQGLSFGAALSTNKVSSKAEAFIDYTSDGIDPLTGGLVTPYAGPTTIDADRGVAISATDNAVIGALLVLESKATATTNNFASPDATGYGFAVALNDIRGDTLAYIEDATVTADGGNVAVSASEASILTSKVSVAAETSTEGGSIFQGSSSVSVAAIAATNVVQGNATARMTDSDITTSSLVVDVDNGNVAVTAENTSSLTANAVNATESGGKAIGVTLAFNSIGWDSQNLLFNTLDTLIGSPEISGAFNADDRSKSMAYLSDTEVGASGALAVGATAGATITSSVDNRASSDASSTLTAAEGLSFGLLAAQNKVSSAATAYIDFTTAIDPLSVDDRISVGDGLSVTASDTAVIDATISLESDSTANASAFGGVAGTAGAAGYGFSVSVNDVRGGAKAYIEDATVLATGGDVLVSATENASLTALVEVAVETSASGGKLFGGSSAESIAAIAATNVQQGGADAHVTGSRLTTTSAAADEGDVTVSALNTAVLTSDVVNLTSGGGKAVGVTLSFNSMGWAPQNLLFNAVDALIGSPEVSAAFGADGKSDAVAYLSDTTVDATGQLTVDASMSSTLTSSVDNRSTSAASSTFFSTQGLSFGAALSTNKVSSKAEADGHRQCSHRCVAGAGVEHHGDDECFRIGGRCWLLVCGGAERYPRGYAGVHRGCDGNGGRWQRGGECERGLDPDLEGQRGGDYQHRGWNPVRGFLVEFDCRNGCNKCCPGCFKGLD
jgi:hypothetical protein